MVDRLNVAEDDRNRAEWADVIAKGKKASVCWALDAGRWKRRVARNLAVNKS